MYKNYLYKFFNYFCITNDLKFYYEENNYIIPREIKKNKKIHYDLYIHSFFCLNQKTLKLI